MGAWFAPNIPYAGKSFWMHPMVLLHDMGQVEAPFGQFRDGANLDVILVHGLRWMDQRLGNHFGDSVISMQDRCMIYAERAIGSEIILSAPDRTPR
jgi:hypothetical protein